MSDPYVVHCPTCLAPAGAPCASLHKKLDFAHWSRRRFARARQARRAQLVAARPQSEPTMATSGPRGSRRG